MRKAHIYYKYHKSFIKVFKNSSIIIIEVIKMSLREEKIKSVDGYQLSLLICEAQSPKAVIQMIHGMEEHKERYIPFMEYLAKNGYTSIISDLRGHGKDAPILSHISNKKGDKLLIFDQMEINRFIKENYKDVPVYLFGHSMGTIISRVLIQLHGDEFTKLALSGYVNPNPVAGVGVGLVRSITAVKGPKKNSKLMDNMSVGSFNKKIENPRTELDWLSYNEENVDKYIEDPLCGVPFTLGSYYALMKLLSRMANVRAYRKVEKEFPILLISGKDDPCTGAEKGRQASKKLLKKAGYANIEVVTLENMRHEILNEKDNATVYKTILEFFDK